LYWNIVRLAFLVLPLLGAGCSGINASHSVSPASFFLPGLLHYTPAPDSNSVPTPQQEPVSTLARAD